MAKSKPSFVPPIEKYLLAQLRDPSNWFLEITKENIDWFNRVLDSVPRKYKWEFLNVEAFHHLVKSLEEKLPEEIAARDLYRLFWKDILGQIEAFSVMTAWRLGEIARSAVWAIRRNDVVCAAVMSRAALETAAAYAWFQTEIRPALDKIGTEDVPILMTKDLEEKLLKVIYASSLEDSEAFYRPERIGRIIDKIATQIPHQEIIKGTYFMLCQVAHPNWAGRSIYITHREPGRMSGHEFRTISSTHGSDAIVVLRSSITALSWATGTFSSSCVALQGGVGKMTGHLDRVQPKR
jgi:hypothetical protein